MKSTVFSRRQNYAFLVIAVVIGAMPITLSAGQNRSNSIPAIEQSNLKTVGIVLPNAVSGPFAAAGERTKRFEPALVLALQDKEKEEDAVQPPVFKPGSADEVVYNFCMAIADDNTATASDYVSSNAKGIAAQLRDGELAESKIEDLVSFFKHEIKPTSERGDAKRGLRNARNQTMTFSLKKEKDVYKITDLALTKPKK